LRRYKEVGVEGVVQGGGGETGTTPDGLVMEALWSLELDSVAGTAADLELGDYKNTKSNPLPLLTTNLVRGA